MDAMGQQRAGDMDTGGDRGEKGEARQHSRVRVGASKMDLAVTTLCVVAAAPGLLLHRLLARVLAFRLGISLLEGRLEID